VPGVRAPLIKETPEPQFQGEERIEIDSLGQDDALVAAVYHIPSWHSIQSPKITFLKYILGGEEHGIAFQEIREKRQLSYGPDVILFGNDKTRYLLFGFTVNKNRLDEALEAIDISIEKVKKGDFHSELLEAYRLSNLPSQIFQFSQPGWIGRVLTQRHEKERYGFETTSLERLQVGLNLTNQDAIDMANQYLGKNRLIVTSK
jgi:predicted Zn-dependent peptidase